MQQQKSLFKRVLATVLASLLALTITPTQAQALSQESQKICHQKILRYSRIQGGDSVRAKMGLNQRYKPKCYLESIQAIERYSKEFGVKTALVVAITVCESQTKPSALGRNKNGTTDSGLGQLNSRYLRSWTRAFVRDTGWSGGIDPFDPEFNAAIVSWLIATRHEGQSVDKRWRASRHCWG
jgi:hypothetical protein